MVNEFVNLIHRHARRYGEREALRYRNFESGVWESLSWQDFERDVERAALATILAGVQEHGKVAVFTNNCPEVLITHFAAFFNRAVPVPIYATSSRDEVAYIINDSGATVLFAGDQRQYDIARQARNSCEGLKQIVTLNPLVKYEEGDDETITWAQWLATAERADDKLKTDLLKRQIEGDPNDLMYLIYTSGTTGVPKGVMLSHSNMCAAMDNHVRRMPFLDPKNDISLSFLPFSHIFELGWTMVCLWSGIRVAINYDPHDIQRAVRDIKPNYMCSVPRFWEKVYTAIMDNLATAKPVVKLLIKRAISVGKSRNLKYIRLGKSVPMLLEKEYQYYEKKVYSKLRHAIGVDNSKMYPTAGAMLSDNITELLRAVGIDITIGYGLSETNASVSFYPLTGWELGTVGQPIPDVEVKIGDNNEILVKGPTVMQGYYNMPEETARVLEPDGWFHTGDCGEITATGQLVLTERLKDMFKTSNGKYIAPQVLETMLGQDKYIEQVAVIGDGKKYVSALIVPSFDELKAFAEKKNIECRTNEDLVNNEEIRSMIEQRINGYQSDLASYEQIKRFVLLPRPFTMESGELTNTLKIKRAVINKRYAKLIDAMYAADFRKKQEQDL